MTNPLRDKLAERLLSTFAAECGTGPNWKACQAVASRLLESVPGERELAVLIAERVLKELVNDKTGRFSKEAWADIFARFLREHVGAWVKSKERLNANN